jgi:hypothetical protein
MATIRKSEAEMHLDLWENRSDDTGEDESDEDEEEEERREAKVEMELKRRMKKTETKRKEDEAQDMEDKLSRGHRRSFH